jgi:ribosomal protein L7/L12
MSEAIEQVVELVEKMTLLEVAELVTALEDKFGVSAAAPVAMAAMPGDAGGAAAAEQTEFDAVLTVTALRSLSEFIILDCRQDFGSECSKEAKGQ